MMEEAGRVGGLLLAVDLGVLLAKGVKFIGRVVLDQSVPLAPPEERAGGGKTLAHSVVRQALSVASDETAEGHFIDVGRMLGARGRKQVA